MDSTGFRLTLALPLCSSVTSGRWLHISEPGLGRLQDDQVRLGVFQGPFLLSASPMNQRGKSAVSPFLKDVCSLLEKAGRVLVEATCPGRAVTATSWEAESLGRCRAIMGGLLPIPAVSCLIRRSVQSAAQPSAPVFFLPEGLLGFLAPPPKDRREESGVRGVRVGHVALQPCSPPSLPVVASLRGASMLLRHCTLIFYVSSVGILHLSMSWSPCWLATLISLVIVSNALLLCPSLTLTLPCPHTEGGLPPLPGRFDWMRLSDVLHEKDHKGC